jgi:hypothetical protein
MSAFMAMNSEGLDQLMNPATQAQNSGTRRGLGTCNVVITVTVAQIVPEKSVGELSEMQDRTFEWEIISSGRSVWNSLASNGSGGPLKMNEVGVATGSARLGIGPLLQAVHDARLTDEDFLILMNPDMVGDERFEQIEDKLYKNFAVLVRVGEELVSLEIDMCIHGC